MVRTPWYVLPRLVFRRRQKIQRSRSNLILIGTAGFKFSDWKGKFYPAGLADKDMLSYYASVFSTLEIDYSYYSMPYARTLEAMVRKVPAGFVFTIKAHKSMTHDIPPNDDDLAAAFSTFTAAIKPLIDNSKFGCVLMQFPWGFRKHRSSVDYIKRLPHLIKSAQVVVEFRNREWVSEDTWSLLRDSGLGYCCVDEPDLRSLMPPVSLATSRTGYVRFHGRNKAKWYNHENASDRYDYLYSEAELQEWGTKITKLEEVTDRVFVLFNNCHEGQAAQNARDMLRLFNLEKVIQGELI